jgi:hypothetical protein
MALWIIKHRNNFPLILSRVGMWLQTGFGLSGLIDTARDYTVRFTITHTQNSGHSHIFTSRCSIAASNRGCSPYSGFPNYPRPQLTSSHSNGSHPLNRTSSLCQSLTSQLNWLNSPQSQSQSYFMTHKSSVGRTHSSLTGLHITSVHGQHRKHLSYVVYWSLPSNGRCLICFAIIA